MATHTKRKSTARSRGKRRAKDARSDATRRLPDGAFNPDAEVSIWRGITEAEIAKEDTVRVLLTQDTIRQAVRRLVRLAATWEATSGFKGMLPQLQEHNVRVLENVVALLDVHDRDAPILFVDGFRITRADQELVILHAMVAAELENYRQPGDAAGAIDRLAWTLGNSFRVPREQIERAKDACPPNTRIKLVDALQQLRRGDVAVGLFNDGEDGQARVGEFIARIAQTLRAWAEG